MSALQSQSTSRSLKDYLGLVGRGFAMGASDIISTGK
jgi:hypothetical protein